MDSLDASWFLPIDYRTERILTLENVKLLFTEALTDGSAGHNNEQLQTMERLDAESNGSRLSLAILKLVRILDSAAGTLARLLDRSCRRWLAIGREAGRDPS